MLFLIFAILASTVVVHCFRHGQNRGLSVDGLLLVNYLMAATVGWAQAATAAPLPLESVPGLLGLALATGSLFIGAFYLLDYGVRKLGPSVATASARMSAVIPVGLSLLIFAEVPGPWALLGIAVALLALPLSLPPSTKRQPWSWALLGPSLLVFAAFGVNDFTLKLQNQWFVPETKPWFLAFVYTTALTIAVVRSLTRTHKSVPLSPSVWLWGAVLGGANFASTACFSWALSELPGSQAYTLGSVGSIAVVTLTSLGLWKEKLTLRVGLFLVLAAAAIVLIRL